MPLRDDLLLPVSDDAPAGVDLAYDKLFDQIKEARTEDDDTLPAGTWSRTLKKADRALVVRLAGEALATRSKDLRLAAWYGEALLRREGFPQLTPLLQLLQQLQEEFWDGLFPLLDEDGDAGRRIGALESAASLLAAQVKLLPITRSGINSLQTQDARALGYEKDATTQEKKDLRHDAVQRGRVLLEELDSALAETPKAFYAETEGALAAALETTQALDSFHEGRYGEDPPSFVRLKSAIEDVRRLVSGILVEKRKLDPDPEPEEIAAQEKDTAEVAAIADPFARFDPRAAGSLEDGTVQGDGSALAAPVDGGPAPTPVSFPSAGEGAFTMPGIEPASRGAALAQVAAAVRFLSRNDAFPETAYALAAAPGVALLFRVEADHAWPPPVAGVRQSLRKLAREARWAELERAGLEALAAQPEAIWLDLHRYLWQAAEALGHRALAANVVAMVRGCLEQLPDLGKAMLEDDTPMATMETQGWLRALQPEPGGDAPATPAQMVGSLRATFAPGGKDRRERGEPVKDVFSEALALLKGGRAAEAISLLARDAEEQPSGRLRFERRLQTAELCLQAGHAKVAQPLLADLTAELERRTLEGWESASLLGKPLALTIRCLDGGATSTENRDTLFARLCRLDPVAAAALDRRDAGGTGKP